MSYRSDHKSSFRRLTIQSKSGTQSAYSSPIHRSFTKSMIFSTPSTSSGWLSKTAPGTMSAEDDPLDFSLLDAVSDEFKISRTDEKEKLIDLNNRFANYIEKVRSMEQQNKMLNAELQELKGKGNSKIGSIYEQELKKLRQEVDQISKDKARIEVERDNLLDDIHKLKVKLRSEIQQREEAENNLTDFREDVDEATLACVDLQRKIGALQDEITFLKKLHEEEIRNLEVQDQNHHVKIEMDTARTDLSSALQAARSQFDKLASKNISETEVWYKTKISDLSQNITRNNEALRLAKQEANDNRREAQALKCEVEALKGTKESLERQKDEMEDRFNKETIKFQETLSHLEDEIQNLTEQMSHRLSEYQDLLKIKVALDAEIATYRKLLESEEDRFSIQYSPIPINLRLQETDVEEDKQPEIRSPKRTLSMKTIELKDGEILSETSHEFELEVAADPTELSED